MCLYKIERVPHPWGILAFCLRGWEKLVYRYLNVCFIFKSNLNIFCLGGFHLCHVLPSSKYVNIDFCLCRNSSEPQISKKCARHTHRHTHTSWFIHQIWWKWGGCTKQKQRFHISIIGHWPTPQYVNDREPSDTILSMLGLPRYATVLLYLELTSRFRKTY